jgi:general secretion pathway protein M
MSAPALKLPAAARARRALAIGLLVLCAVIVIAAVGVPVLLLHRHYDQAIDRMTRQWQSQSAFNARRAEMVSALEALKAREPRKLFLKGTTAALAAAELQDSVKASIEANGGRVLAASGLPTKDDGGYRLATATIQLNVNNVNLRRVLHALESQTPFVFIDNLMVRSQTPPGWKPPPGAQEPDLYVQFDAAGLAIAPTEAVPVASADPAAQKGKP